MGSFGWGESSPKSLSETRVSPRAGTNGTPIPFHNPARQVVRFHEGGASTPVIVLNNAAASNAATKAASH